MSNRFIKPLSNKYCLLLIVVLIGALLRFYKLNYFPVQLNHDEVSQLYDAISIAQTGKDIYGNFLPTMFKSVNDFKSPFYTYITSLFYFILGGGELTVKLPGAIFGWLSIVAVYFLVLKLFKNWMIATYASFFTAIAPFELFFSRKSFENVAGIFFMLTGFACLFSYVNKLRLKIFYLGIIFLAIAAYTYFSHAILIPLLFASFLLIYRKYFQKQYKKEALPLILFVILLIPLLIIVITNPGARYRSQTVFITQDVNLGRNIEYSKSSDNLVTSLLRNKAILDFSFNRYLEQFNLDFIFQNGLDFTNQGPLNQGLLLLVQLPLLILGIIYLVKLEDYQKEKIFILLWIVIGMLPSGLTFEAHSPHRSIMVFTMLNIISAVGLFYLLKNSKKIFSVTLIFTFTLSLIYFIHLYFVNFPFEKSQSIQYPFKQVAQFAWENYYNFNQIIFDPLYGEIAPVVGTATHYYLAYYGNYSPREFQKEYKLGTRDREVIFDKFSIRKIDWREDQYLKNVLMIGSPWSLPIQSVDKNKIVKIFYYYNGQPAFYAVKL